MKNGAGCAAHAFCREDDMQFLLISLTLLGAIMACSTRAAFSSEDQSGLVGRWELASIDLPIALRRGEHVVIESGTIRMKDNCNEITLDYSIEGDELNANPVTTTIVGCDPRSRFADEDQIVYQAVQHSRYQIDGDVLRLSSLNDSPFDYKLEFHRIR